MPRPGLCRRQHVEELLKQLTAEYESVFHECKHLRSASAVCHCLKPVGTVPTKQLVTPESNHHACHVPRSTHALKDTEGTSSDVSVSRVMLCEDSAKSLVVTEAELARSRPVEVVENETGDNPCLQGIASCEPAVFHARELPFLRNPSKQKLDDRVVRVLAQIKSCNSRVSLPPAVVHPDFFERWRTDTRFKREVFDGTMAGIILLNTIYIGIAPEVIQTKQVVFVIDAAFAFCFLAERIFKLTLFGVHDYCFGTERRWNLFETVLVIMSIAEFFWIEYGPSTQDEATAPLLRLVRLGRIAKVIRVLRLHVFKELMVMVQGILGGLRTLGWSFVLISLPLYIAALILRDTAGKETKRRDDATENFENLSKAFFTLFRCVVVGDCSDTGGRPIFVLLVEAHGWGYAVLYIMLVFLMTFGLFNVIVSIYVENTVAAAKYNELVSKHVRLQDAEMFSKKVRELLELVACARNGGTTEVNVSELVSGEITLEFFQDLCQNPRFRDILCELDVADEDQMDLFDTLDVDGGGTLDIEELVTGIGKLRGDSRRADVISVGLTVRALQASFQHFQSRWIETMEAQQSAFHDIVASTHSLRSEKLSGAER
jgi:hypothetical protein